MEKTYQCICGKTFDKPNSFNAHKRHCKEHLQDKGKYEQYLEGQANFKKAGKENSTKQHLDSENLNKEKLIKWISEQHRCEKCGKIMIEKFGPGRFCSRKCSNSRIKSEDSKKKVSQTLVSKHAIKSKEHLFDKSCPHCAAKVQYKDRYRRTCKVCKNYIDGRKKKFKNIGIVPTEQQAAKTINFQYNGPELPEIVDQKRSHGFFPRNQLSYAEQFWKKVLDNNNIAYEHDFKIRNKANTAYYRLDFLIDGYFDLEIDGSQHQFCVLKDLNRTLYLESLGYKCFRLAWVNPNNDTNKLIVNCQIDQLFKELGKERLF